MLLAQFQGLGRWNNRSLILKLLHCDDVIIWVTCRVNHFAFETRSKSPSTTKLVIQLFYRICVIKCTIRKVRYWNGQQLSRIMKWAQILVSKVRIKYCILNQRFIIDFIICMSTDPVSQNTYILLTIHCMKTNQHLNLNLFVDSLNGDN